MGANFGLPVCKVLKEKAKLDTTTVLKTKGVMRETFFEVSKQSSARAMIWKACRDTLDSLKEKPVRTKKD